MTGSEGRPGRERGRRLFFALWPEDADRRAVRAAFEAAVAAAGGRPVADANLHLTLEFVGAVDAAQRTELEAVGAGLTVRAAEVSLDRLDWWPRAATLVAAASAPAAGLLALQSTLRGALKARGFRVDERPYRPHVTLARRVAAPPPVSDAPIVRWPLRTVALVESERAPGGSRYVPLATWTASARGPRN
jgi:2'-5' RNA ligase